MADVTFGYTYTDGAAFNSSGHNANMYSATNGVSLLGEMNGRVQTANMATPTILAEHILPRQSKELHSENMLGGLKVVDNMMSAETEVNGGFITIPGLSVKKYVAFARPTVEFTWQTFFHDFRFIGLFPAGAYSTKNASLLTYLDGTPLSHTRCKIPITMEITSTPGTAVTAMFCNEANSAYTFSQSHIATNIGIGYHTLEVRLWLEVCKTNESNYKFPRGTNPEKVTTVWGTGGVGGYTTNWMGALPALATIWYPHDVYNRASFGVRNVIMSEY